MGVELVECYVSTPSLALPLQGGGDIGLMDYLGSTQTHDAPAMFLGMGA